MILVGFDANDISEPLLSFSMLEKLKTKVIFAMDRNGSRAAAASKHFLMIVNG